MADELLGQDFLLYWDSANNYALPTWVKQISFGDSSYDPAIVAVEIPLRIPYVTYKRGRSDGRLSFTMNYDPTNTFHRAVRNAIRDGTKIHLAHAEGIIVPPGADYVHAWFLLTGSNNTPLDDVGTYEVEGMFHHDIGSGMDETPAYVEGV